MYIFFYLFYTEKYLVLTTMITFIEVSIHSILCVYFIGWQGGFYVYPLCLIPIIYFVSINILKKSIYGHIMAIATIVNYQLSENLSSNRIALFQEQFKVLDKPIYSFNTISASFLLAFLVCSFLYEMRYIQEDLEEMNEALKNIANIDPLTNISNRRFMNEKIKIQIEEFNKNLELFCIAICDIDNFKNVNDTYGHDCGDLVLKGMADIFIENSKKFNIDICRWGGEEFLILIKNSDINNAKFICEEILKDIRKFEILYKDELVKVTMTFGLSEFSLQNNDIEEVLKEADVNLYKGKSTTKNCVVIN
ncbi:GGDEF domain-containing protein [uncultured Tyzzerella sp.]|uniref:GGDEF domain-containing protein n=1 Tax=uncultured Tyzzerella sp. TaxID=2321398 RepID=UPI002942F677|nr:GGDEF domain-containing protein [uncultured Tyzzerella sp.]